MTKLGNIINKLYILVPPKLIVSNTNVTAKIGEKVILNCFSEGNPKPKVTWTKLSDSKLVDWIVIRFNLD